MRSSFLEDKGTDIFLSVKHDSIKSQCLIILRLRQLRVLNTLESGGRKFGTDTHFGQVFYFRLNRIWRLYWQYLQIRLITFNVPLRSIYRINLLIINKFLLYLVKFILVILSNYVSLNINIKVAYKKLGFSDITNSGWVNCLMEEEGDTTRFGGKQGTLLCRLMPSAIEGLDADIRKK